MRLMRKPVGFTLPSSATSSYPSSPQEGGRLIALAQDTPTIGADAVNLVYVSRNGGRTWRLNTRLGAL